MLRKALGDSGRETGDKYSVFGNLDGCQFADGTEHHITTEMMSSSNSELTSLLLQVHKH